MDTDTPKFRITLMAWNDANVTITGDYQAPTMVAAICAAKNEHGWVKWTFKYGVKL